MVGKFETSDLGSEAIFNLVATALYQRFNATVETKDAVDDDIVYNDLLLRMRALPLNENRRQQKEMPRLTATPCARWSTCGSAGSHGSVV